MSLEELERRWRPKAFQDIEYEVQVTETIASDQEKQEKPEARRDHDEEPEVQTFTVPGPARRASLCISNGLVSPVLDAGAPTADAPAPTSTTFRIRRLSVMDLPDPITNAPAAKAPVPPPGTSASPLTLSCIYTSH